MQGMKEGGRRVKAPAQEQEFPKATFDRRPPTALTHPYNPGAEHSELSASYTPRQ